MKFHARRSLAVVVACLAVVAAACGSSGGDGIASAAAPARPTIVATTSILGDVVGRIVGDSAEVITIMPVGADPHDFQASAQEVAALTTADALIVNGADFEEGLLDVIDAAEDDGVPTFEAISTVPTLEYDDDHDTADDHDDHDDDHDTADDHDDHDDDHDTADDHDDHDDHDDDHDTTDDHDDDHDTTDDHDDHDDDHDTADDHDDDHVHTGADPHFFTDPARMVAAVEGIARFLVSNVEFADPAAVERSTDTYIAELIALDADVAALVESIPEANRVIVTNHQVFDYFAERYGFEVVGTVIPNGGTTDSVGAGDLAELVATVEAEGVRAIFSDTSASDDLVQTLAAEVGAVAVVELFTESLGEQGSGGATYLEMIRTNAERITAALG